MANFLLKFKDEAEANEKLGGLTNTNEEGSEELILKADGEHLNDVGIEFVKSDETGWYVNLLRDALPDELTSYVVVTEEG